MKKRIGNDISFVWHIYRKSGDTQVPENFTGKEVEVKLISPLQRPVTIENVSIATGVVTFTFRGKHQVTLGNYVAVLQENTGENGMVTLDVVSAVTLVPHSYMEEDGDEGDVIEATSVELDSEIGQGIDAYTKAEADALFLRKRVTQGGQYAERGLGTTMVDTIDGVGTLSTDVYAGSVSIGHNTNTLTLSPDAIIKSVAYGSPVSVVWANTATSQIPAATTESNGLMSAADKNKLNALPTDAELTEELAGKQDTINDLAAIRSGAQAGSSAYQKPNTGIPATDLASAVQVSLGKADTALQEHQSLAGLVNTGNYNTVSKKIELKHDNTVLAEIDATAFIKDGMVSSVTINNGYLVITFNTDAGKEPISIALTDIFNPANYYTKTEIDANFPKYDEQGKVRIQTDSNNYTVISAGNISFKNPTWGNFSVNDLASMINSKASKATTLAGYGITDAKIENGVITLGNNTITPITQHQDITGKADKVSNATNGNFAALDSNGNLIDSGHKHSDYLTQHQDLSNYVQKSQTAGLLKNDGTVDTTQYTTNTGTITGITMNGQSKGTSGNVDLGTVVTDVSGKEDITPIEAVASGTTAITAQVNKYYEVAGTVSSLTVTLPTPTANTEVTMVVVHLTVDASPTVIVTSVNEVVKFSAAYSVVANKEYELSCLYNGSKWIVSSMEVAV